MKPLKPRPLTDGEVKAYRIGYLAALDDVASHAEERRIRIAARSEAVRTPEHWPVQAPAKAVKR